MSLFSTLTLIMLGLSTAAWANRIDPAAAHSLLDRRTRLQSRWQALTPRSTYTVRRLDGNGANPHEILTEDGSFVVRSPLRRAHGVEDAQVVSRPNRLEQSLLRNSALQRLAAHFGRPEWVPSAISGGLPFAVGDLPTKYNVMVMEHLGDAFRNGFEPQGRAWFTAVDEDSRLLGASLDLLAEFGDRTPRNFMLNATGALRLVDPESAFGGWADRSRIHASAFFPGLSLGYGSQQSHFGALPSRLRLPIEQLADSVDTELAKILEVDRETALLPIHYARRIRRVGLSEAINEYLGSVKLESPR